MKDVSIRFLKAGIVHMHVPENSTIKEMEELSKVCLDTMGDNELCIAMQDVEPHGVYSSFDADNFQVEAIEDSTNSYNLLYSTPLWDKYMGSAGPNTCKPISKEEITELLDVAEEDAVYPTELSGKPMAQIGGDHYVQAIEPLEYIEANNMGFSEANVIKYVSRWRRKNGVEDLEKAKWYIERLIKLSKQEG